MPGHQQRCAVGVGHTTSLALCAQRSTNTDLVSLAFGPGWHPIPPHFHLMTNRAHAIDHFYQDRTKFSNMIRELK